MTATTTIHDLDEMLRRARTASVRTAALSAEQRRSALLGMANGIEHHRESILEANAEDMSAARDKGLSPAMLDRLQLNDKRLDGIARAVRAVAAQPDILGEILYEHMHDDGLRIRRMRVPLGVIAMIYESRPNVTVDAACLCFKAGNAVVLKGGSEALASNSALTAAITASAVDAGLPPDAVQLIRSRDRAVTSAMLERDDVIDLVIPRGGESLIRAVAERATMPVMKHYKGVCHVYIDIDADQAMAMNIVQNAKCQRPGVCNAAETLLVHAGIANELLPPLAERLRAAGVDLRGCDASRAIVDDMTPATEADWHAEYLALILAIRIVEDLDAALAHIERYGSRHSDAIVTRNADAAHRFTRDVDSSSVFVNASTRFTDGAVFGLGAEIGISTDKLHARGPCGAASLTTYKYVVIGDGHVRH